MPASSSVRAALAALLLLAAAGCATLPEDPEERAEWEEINDPLEPMNRTIFAFNQQLDAFLLRPLAEVYRTLLPQFVQDRIRNVLRNAGEPVNFVNAILQGNGDNAGTALGRLMVNTTFGLGGMWDVAEYELGVSEVVEDFGQTLAVWGAGEGAYLVLPVLGPSSVRDGVGRGVDLFTNPLNWYLVGADLEYVGYAMAGTGGIDTRSRNIETLEELERTSIDFYATLRSLYRQRRADLIGNGYADETSPFLE